MKKHTIMAFGVAVALMATSCVTRIYPGMVTNASSTKEGIAKKTVWFNIAKDIDLSIATAAKNGGIKKVATVDYGVTIGMFKRTYFTRVTGE